MTTNQQITPGDIVEIETAVGPAYVQVTHRHPSSSDVVRVLAGPNDEQPSDLEALTQREARLVAMVPLASAIESGRLKARKIGTASIPEAARRFPTFRMPIRDKKDGVRGEVAYWWFWDGEGLTYDADPPPEMQAYPLREVLSIDEFLRKLP